MDVVIYTRVSTEDQKEHGFSLQDQERRLRHYCSQNGKNILEHYQDNYSAKNFNRPAFQKFLIDLREKKVRPKELICVRWDRFSRNVEESLKMVNQLKHLGVTLHFIENNSNLSNPEELIPYLLNMALPQVENERRGLNTKMGMRQALRQGRWVWHAPKGYINDQINKIVKKGEDAHFILRAFTEVSYGIKSVDAIRKELNNDGFKCCKQSLLNILRNRFYMGQIVIDAWKNEPEERVKGIHEPIIDEELFHRVQDVLAGRNKKQSKPSKYKELFPLRGHLLCKECGNKLTASSSQGRSKKYDYYHCQNGCKERLNAEVVNSSFDCYLGSIKVNDEVANLYREIIQDIYKENEGTRESKIIELNRKTSTLKEKLKSLDNKLLSDTIGGDDYKRMSTDIKQEIDKSEKEKDELSVSDTGLDQYFRYGVTFLSHLPYYYRNAPIELKHKIVGSIFPEKLIFENKNYRTARENSLISLICRNTSDLRLEEKKKATVADGLSNLALPLGLEPRTL